jgi:hypothetical protein
MYATISWSVVNGSILRRAHWTLAPRWEQFSRFLRYNTMTSTLTGGEIVSPRYGYEDSNLR